MKLSSLVCEADYAAVGKIVQLDESYFYLEVKEYVLGQLDLDTLKIQKFGNWPCGRRYYEYEIGQQELVFFRKSNYVIDNYDLLGYGAGGEFELPIKNDSIYYNYRYGKLKPYGLTVFLKALQDFGQIKADSKSNSKALTEEDKLLFASKSKLHKEFIECRIRTRAETLKAPTNGYLANLEKPFLYQDYDNKVFAFGFDIDSVELYVDDAIVRKQNGYFVVKPKDGWTRRWLNIYSKRDTSRSNVLYNQIFEIIELPEPRLYFGGYLKDTLYYGSDAIPKVAHYLDYMHKDDNLKYEILSFTLTVASGGKFSKFEIKSSNGTPELRTRLRKLKDGDKISLTNIFVLYPNNSVKQIEDKTLTFKGKN